MQSLVTTPKQLLQFRTHIWYHYYYYYYHHLVAKEIHIPVLHTMNFS